MTNNTAIQERIDGFLEKIKNTDVDQYDYTKVYNFLGSQKETAQAGIKDLEEDIERWNKHSQEVIEDIADGKDADVFWVNNPLVTEGTLNDFNNIEANFHKIFVIYTRVIATQELIIDKYKKLIDSLVEKLSKVEEHKILRERAEQDLNKLKEMRSQDRLDAEKLLGRMEKYMNTVLEHQNARYEAALNVLSEQGGQQINVQEQEEIIEEEEEIEEETLEQDLSDYVDANVLHRLKREDKFEHGVELAELILNEEVNSPLDVMQKMNINAQTLEGLITDCKSNTWKLLSEDFKWKEE